MKQQKDLRQRLPPDVRDGMIEAARAQLADPQFPDARPCDYDGKETRNVHLDVCMWHLEENDPACVKCAYRPEDVRAMEDEQCELQQEDMRLNQQGTVQEALFS